MSVKVSSIVYDTFAILEFFATSAFTPQEIVSVSRPKVKRNLGVILEGDLSPLAMAFFTSMYRQNNWVAVKDNSSANTRYMVIKGNREGIQPGELFVLKEDENNNPQIAWEIEDFS